MENFKIILVMNKSLEPGVALNAAAHLGLGLAGLLRERDPDALSAVRYQNYTDADGGEHPFISALPLIVLRAKSSEVRKCRTALADVGIPFLDFTNQMIKDTFREQLERSRQTPEAELEYFGLGAIGTREKLDPITRRLSLWR